MPTKVAKEELAFKQEETTDADAINQSCACGTFTRPAAGKSSSKLAPVKVIIGRASLRQQTFFA
jgi:hypothetical protein